jgi:hypothetical protein
MPKLGSNFKVIVDRISLVRVIKNVINVREAALKSAELEFTKITEAVKRSSQIIVPQKTGALEKSAYARVIRRANDIDAVVGYDEHNRLGYAWIRHQVPAKTYTTPGTTHRYLSLAFMQYEDVVDDLVMKTYRKRLKKIGFKETSISSQFGTF